MAVCPECGNQVGEDAIVCKHCGTTLKCEEWDADEVLYYYGQIHKPIPAETSEHQSSEESSTRCQPIVRAKK